MSCSAAGHSRGISLQRFVGTATLNLTITSAATSPTPPYETHSIGGMNRKPGVVGWGRLTGTREGAQRRPRAPAEGKTGGEGGDPTRSRSARGKRARRPGGAGRVREATRKRSVVAERGAAVRLEEIEVGPQ